MTQPTAKPKPKSSMNRGAKVLIASLSVATTLNGWALFTLREPFIETEAAAQETEIELAVLPTEIPLQTLRGVTNIALAPLPTTPLPKLSSLHVRGLRYVGEPVIVPTAVPQLAVPQGPAPRERNNGGGQSVSPPPQSVQQPPPPRQPEPKPKPPRKTKSSK